MRGIFGWSYPPGCSSVPGDEDVYCEMCGRNIDECVCDECPICSQFGDRKCYSNHGMVITTEQIEGLLKMEDAIDLQAARDEAEYEYFQSETYKRDQAEYLDLMFPRSELETHMA